jgi:transglutaminase-like putative cysteine protease
MFLAHALRGGAATAVGFSAVGAGRSILWRDEAAREILGPAPPSYSIIPVVGDGKWIWTKPPEGKTGYLEPRPYRARIGIEMEGTGYAKQIMATTVTPVQHPEQKIDNVEISTSGCQARLRELKNGAAQLFLAAPEIREGQTIRAVAEYELTVYKQYHAFKRDQFAYKQEPPRDVRANYLKDSPGIQTSIKEVRDLAQALAGGVEHPWEKAEKFHEWVPKNIEARIGPYTSVKAALDKRVGDCEERSAVFVALCRAVGIPSRLVWVPNHNWSEIYLHDMAGKGHWVPVHTSCYDWFGWVGAHELVLQKGDRVRVPERSKHLRLLDDWAQFIGSRPNVRWTAELLPLPASEGEDAGPGARRKDGKGEWVLVGEHALNKHMRR